jgi:PilZ domain.
MTNGEVTYFVQGSGVKPEQGAVQDLSISGIRMVNARELKKDAALELTLQIPGINATIKAQGRVTWQRRITMQQFDTGVEFTKIESAVQETLSAFIKDNTGMIEDRRAYVRFQLRTVVTYRLESEPSVDRSCESLDVSSSGLKLYMKEKLEKGTRLQVLFNLPEPWGNVFAKCTVVAWSRQEDKNMFETGVEFIEIGTDARDKISSYIRKSLGIVD